MPTSRAQMFLERKARATNFYVFGSEGLWEHIGNMWSLDVCLVGVWPRLTESMYMLQLIFLSQVSFPFPLFLVMILCANEVETKEKWKLPEIKITYIYVRILSTFLMSYLVQLFIWHSESILRSLLFSFLSFFFNRLVRYGNVLICKLHSSSCNWWSSFEGCEVK